ncbi:MAG TPA: hypothetical protein VL588_08590 [Bdellovibrionota bacterium]|jgi:hypothetical protein|nr:hypothetical protein [Bdellovibrionota bacterium]
MNLRASAWLIAAILCVPIWAAPALANEDDDAPPVQVPPPDCTNVCSDQCPMTYLFTCYSGDGTDAPPPPTGQTDNPGNHDGAAAQVHQPVAQSQDVPTDACGRGGPHGAHAALLPGLRQRFHDSCEAPAPGRSAEFMTGVRLSEHEDPTDEDLAAIDTSQEPWSGLTSRVTAARAAHGAQRRTLTRQLFDAATRRSFDTQTRAWVAEYRRDIPRALNDDLLVSDGHSFSVESALAATEARAEAVRSALASIPAARRPPWATALASHLGPLSTRSRAVTTLFNSISSPSAHMSYTTRQNIERRLNELQTGCSSGDTCTPRGAGSLTRVTELLAAVPAPVEGETESAEIQRIRMALDGLGESARPLKQMLAGESQGADDLDSSFHRESVNIFGMSDCRALDQQIATQVYAADHEPSCTQYCQRVHPGSTYDRHARRCNWTVSPAGTDGDAGRPLTPPGGGGPGSTHVDPGH